jgi:hypothetical protein
LSGTDDLHPEHFLEVHVLEIWYGGEPSNKVQDRSQRAVLEEAQGDQGVEQPETPQEESALEAEHIEAVSQGNDNTEFGHLDSRKGGFDNALKNHSKPQQAGSKSRERSTEGLEHEDSEGSLGVESDMGTDEYGTDDGFESGYESDEEPSGIAGTSNNLIAANALVLGLQSGHPPVQQPTLQGPTAGIHLSSTSASQLLLPIPANALVPPSHPSALPSFAAPAFQGAALPQPVALAPLPIAAVAPPPIPAATPPFNPRQGRNWRHFILPRFIAAAAANPAGFEAAHALIASTHFRSLTYGPYNDTTARKGDFRSVVITTFLPQYFQTTYPGQRVPPTHKSKIQWHSARIQPEQDAIRLFIQQKLEEGLNPLVTAQVANLRHGGGLNAGVLPGPHVGSSSGASLGSNSGLVIASNTMAGGSQAPANPRMHAPANNGMNAMNLPMTGGFNAPMNTGFNPIHHTIGGGYAPMNSGFHHTRQEMGGGYALMNSVFNPMHQAMGGGYTPMNAGLHQVHHGMGGDFNAPTNDGLHGNNQLGGALGGGPTLVMYSLPMAALSNAGINGTDGGFNTSFQPHLLPPTSRGNGNQHSLKRQRDDGFEDESRDSDPLDTPAPSQPNKKICGSVERSDNNTTSFQNSIPSP